MFDFSMQREAIRVVEEGANKTIPNTELIAHEILNFKTSKRFKAMIDGADYYDGKQDILKKQRTVIGEEGMPEVVENLPNSKQIDNQYKKMVKQKTNYLLGKPFSVQCDDEDYLTLLNSYFNRKFFRQMKNVCRDSLNCGIAWLYVYYNASGELSFKRFRSYEVIPGWTDVDHTELEYLIRFYDVDQCNGQYDEKITKVEYYSLTGIDYYEYYGGVLQPAAPYHTDYFSVNGTNFNWTKMPFIAFKYNEEEIPLIASCKSLQDGLNEILSNFQDNMQEDMRNTILVLVNYDGENLGEFRRNLSTYGAVKVSTNDGVTGDVKTLQIEVNSENYKAIIEIFKKAIIENCMGYDAKDDKIGGTANQMNIQSMYNDIDLDASDMETEFQAALEDLRWFIDAHLATIGAGDFSGEQVEIIFNTDMPMDEGVIIDNIQKSQGLLSTETLVAQHPWVTDAQAEMERLEAEKEQNIEQYGLAFAKTTPKEDDVNGDEEDI